MDVASQIKKLETQINGNVTDLSGLNTTAKTNLVASINELKGELVALEAYTPIDDAHVTGTTTYSSSKITGLITAKTEINDALNTTTNTLSASKVNANIAAAVAAKTQISDTTVKSDANSTSVTYSASKIIDLVNASMNAVLANAPAALDTLKELADAIGDDANFAANMTAALANRVRFDAPQTLTTAQQAQARTNINAYGSVELGDITVDLVAVFRSGLI